MNVWEKLKKGFKNTKIVDMTDAQLQKEIKTTNLLSWFCLGSAFFVFLAFALPIAFLPKLSSFNSDLTQANFTVLVQLVARLVPIAAGCFAYFLGMIAYYAFDLKLIRLKTEVKFRAICAIQVEFGTRIEALERKTA